MNARTTRTKTTPIPVQRTLRLHDLRALTSLPAGRMVPLAAVPLLREDSITRGTLRVNFEMMETVEVLMNAVNVHVKAYLVPHLAFERFKGMDDFNRSFEGLPFNEGDPVVPFIETMPAKDLLEDEIHTYLGKHAKPGTNINTAYIEAYNAIWNFRARNRSPDIALRDRLLTDLAPAFWQHSQFQHIVPDFDQAVIDGEVPLNIVDPQISVYGLLRHNDGQLTGSFADAVHGGPAITPEGAVHGLGVDIGRAIPRIYAELAEAGITVSLSNIELARKTQAFALLRQQYSGHTDEYLIDLLMDGISIPEQAWRQPILLQERSTIFGMSKRYASDSGNLTESVVNGATFIDLNFSVPRVPTGGVVMVVAEITPEQLFERQKDPYLHLADVDGMPQFLRDTLDPEKVSVVSNDYIDVDHDQPDSTFGYAPLNHEWASNPPCIGGRFFRPEVDAGFDEDRQRLWAVETVNPVLSSDFYIASNVHTKPFVVTNQDPFEALTRGAFSIRGNTVFGGRLVEANGDYEAVLEEAPQDRIEKEA